MTEPGGFAVERSGERTEGLAQGIDRKHLVRLRRGEWEQGRSVDLHGLRSADARRALERALREASAAGERCVLVIHGRGLRSESGPVLRDAVVGWLTSAPLAARVMAFASALPRDGGTGACYVLLRRARPS